MAIRGLGGVVSDHDGAEDAGSEEPEWDGDGS
jgi:hypothetical protein